MVDETRNKGSGIDESSEADPDYLKRKRNDIGRSWQLERKITSAELARALGFTSGDYLARIERGEAPLTTSLKIAIDFMADGHKPERTADQIFKPGYPRGNAVEPLDDPSVESDLPATIRPQKAKKLGMVEAAPDDAQNVDPVKSATAKETAARRARRSKLTPRGRIRLKDRKKDD